MSKRKQEPAHIDDEQNPSLCWCRPKVEMINGVMVITHRSLMDILFGPEAPQPTGEVAERLTQGTGETSARVPSDKPA